MKNVIVIFTNNQKLSSNLQHALPDFSVVKTESIDGVNDLIKKNESEVRAIILHLTNANNWLIFSMLQAGYPGLPRFAILAPALDKNDYDLEEKAVQYGALGVTSEKIGLASLVGLIRAHVETEPQMSSKENYLQVVGEVQKELERLNKEFFITNLRTLPQPEIGEDTLNRLKTAFAGLNSIKIIP